ncbi:MAG: Hpt domain-containing protein [Gammaproteobacteria bacterium]|nr:Hpt domain-containing protein [Gammaproteobacteria bacterium]MBU1832162.1 Hpt domain-containing protein [Gammaproteobacteria bacterium]
MNEQEHEGILAIFLAEAEEIVQRLSEQLAELRYGYDGQRILDDIHRGFHTLYGGATVLKMSELAECAQLAERVMERVRTRRVSMTPSLVSLLVAAIGALELMLARRINHQVPNAVDNDLKSRLLRAADRNNSPSAANNPVESLGDPMSVFFDGRLRPRDNQIASLAPSVLHYENTSFAPILGAQSDKAIISESIDGVGSTEFQAYPGSQFETIDSAVATLTRQPLPSISHATSPAIADGDVSHLVSELSWVRQRLMRFRGKGYSSELDKALTYLDLVAQDFDSWERNRDRESDNS